MKLCIDIISRNLFFFLFSNMEDRKIKQVPSGRLVPFGGGGRM
jgi:hypothetical protein